MTGITPNVKKLIFRTNKILESFFFPETVNSGAVKICARIVLASKCPSLLPLLNSRLQSSVDIPAQPCGAKKSGAQIFPKFVMYNNVIVAPLLPKIADCAQQDRVLD